MPNMFLKEQRLNYLKKLAHSNEGVALKEHFEALITQLIDARNYKTDDFETEGKASIKAAAVLKKIMIDLEILGKPKKEIKKNQYI